MKQREQNLWDSFRKPKPRDFRLQRVENGLEAGMADVVGIHTPGDVFWVETKSAPRRPARHSTAVLGAKYGLNIDQQNWIADWLWFGGRAYILVGVGVGTAREIRLISGRDAHRVNDMTFDDLTMMALASTWDSVYAAIRARVM